jgi:hypothetical protein
MPAIITAEEQDQMGFESQYQPTSIECCQALQGVL